MNCLLIGSTLQNGKYEIVKVLGQGGFGITYLAIHTFLDKKVAIKEFFLKDFCDRDETTSQITLGTANTAELVSKLKVKFLKEAKNIAKLNHPNIVSIQDIFEENNTAYYLMDYIEGESLGDKIKRDGAMSESKAVRYIKQVASAIEYMHSRKMNHLDIKPTNIMVRQTDDLPILIDFGTSKQYDSEGEQTSTMAPGFTHGYAPVEQYKPGGVSTFTPQTDIYTLGATLYALLTGNKPPHYSEILEDDLHELPDSVSTQTKKGVEHAMEIRKNKRPGSIHEFLSNFFNGYANKQEGINIGQPQSNAERFTESNIKDVTSQTFSVEEEDTVFATVISMPNEKKALLAKNSCKSDNIIDECEFVDLGLSVLWASHNMGAKRAEELGTFVNKQDVSTTGEVAEWNLKGALVPTIGQFEELRNNCNWAWTEQKGIGGYKIIGRNGNSIFIPFDGGNRDNTFLIFRILYTREAYYDTSPSGQYYLYFSHGDYKLTKYACDYVCPIRLIKQKMKSKFITATIIVCVSIGCVFLLRSQNVLDKLNIKNALEKVSRDVVILEDEDSKITIKLGCEIKYSHRVHSPVGSSYRVEYDKSAFKLSCKTKYDNPESVAMVMCGGDSAVQTYTLLSLKK